MSERPVLNSALFLAGLAGFVFLLYGMYEEGFLNPFLTAGATVILLWPIRDLRAVRGLFLAGGFLFVLWLLSELSGVLLPFALVYVLAYLFNPAVSRVERRWGTPRWVSALSITLLVTGLLVAALLVIVPNLAGEMSTLGARLLRVLNRLQTELPDSGIVSYLVEQGLVDRTTVKAQLAEMVPQQIDQFAASIPDLMNRVIESVGSITSGLIVVVILPVIFFYMLKDYPAIEAGIVDLFPTFHGRRDYLLRAGQIVGKYLRGQLMISAIAAFDVSVALLLLDVPFALLIGLLAGVMNMIPNFGVFLTGMVGVLLSVVFGDPWLLDAVAVAGVLTGQSLLETTVLTPNIMSYQVGVHPVLVVLSLFVFGTFFGFLGLLIAVPTTAILAMFYRAYHEQITPELSSYDYAESD